MSRKIDALRLYSEEPKRREGFSDYFSRLPPTLEAANAWLEAEERRRIATPRIPSKNIRRQLPCDGYIWEQDLRVEMSFFKTHEQGPDETDTQEPESPFPETPSAKTPIQAGSFPDLHFMSQFGEMPTMLQQCAISPPSGMSGPGVAGLDGDGSPGFLGDKMRARTFAAAQREDRVQTSPASWRSCGNLSTGQESTIGG
ncbi:hypothetical protein J3459_016798 [Metarhizium acridum]|nr:hypothetical protein J3459_019426 [Metarhizium acridum]KAG8410976.1 hypothetical protein J3459_016798 [Metarhizium acridum]